MLEENYHVETGSPALGSHSLQNLGRALGGGGGGRGAGAWPSGYARGLPSLADWAGSRRFEVPDICGETIQSEVSLASALLHTPCHLISPSLFPTPRFVNLPRVHYEVLPRT